MIWDKICRRRQRRLENHYHRNAINLCPCARIDASRGSYYAFLRLWRQRWWLPALRTTWAGPNHTRIWFSFVCCVSQQNNCSILLRCRLRSCDSRELLAWLTSHSHCLASTVLVTSRLTANSKRVWRPEINGIRKWRKEGFLFFSSRTTVGRDRTSIWTPSESLYMKSLIN